jgi:hypothetical protein
VTSGAPLILAPDELEGRTHRDDLQAALELGGFAGGVLETTGPDELGELGADTW